MTVPIEDPAEPPHASANRAGSGRGALPRPVTSHSAHQPTIQEICPYLTASSGSWRSAGPHRDHRCGAVDPPGLLSSEKQRRLCLSIEHGACPAFRAARASRAALLAPGLDASVVAMSDAARRPIARTAAVVLEHPRLSAPVARWPLDRAVPQVALVVLMLLAFVALAVARLSSSDAAVAPALSVSPSPSPTVSASATSAPPTATPSVVASGSIAPSGPAVPTASADPAVRTTYKVKKGDTLIGIASKFGTTVTAIRRLNGMSNSSLKIGQVLKIP
jgi:LysM repeat protein